MTTATKKTAKQLLEEAEALKMQKELSDFRALLLSKVLKATPGLDPKAPVAPPKDPKVIELERIFNTASWGSSNTKQSVQQIVEVLVGTKLNTKDTKSKQFMLTIPVIPCAGHDYTPGNVCMFLFNGHDQAVEVKNKTIRIGNSMPTNHLNDPKVFRYPSKAEAEEFVTKVAASKKNIEDLKGYLGSGVL
ncbi:Uncharacterised protein [uncultured archaeon]|nr:Uncharacterised protein [uncultured archaeon]